MAEDENMTARIRVLLADDHLIFRMGLRSLLSGEASISLVGEATTGSQTIEKFKELHPDLLLLDLRRRIVGELAPWAPFGRLIATLGF